MHTFIDPFQKQIWLDKYQYKDETYKNFCSRLSDNIFSTDEIKNEKLFSMLVDFKVLFGGRINANIGVSQEGLTLFNCFIESVTKNPDSLEGILDMLGKFCITLKSEGGVGFCANFFRPAKTLIRKIGVGSPGSVKFLEIFDKASEVITSGSVDKNDSYQGIPTKKSIRKGATMVTMSINHPDVEDFIGAKATPNKLTKMNMSVLISDAFMYAVQNDMDWDLWFPDINFEKYDELWDGNFEKWAEKGFPVVIYKTVRANYLWDLLLRNSYCVPGHLIIPAYINDVLVNTSIEEIHNNFQKKDVSIDVLSVNNKTLKIERKPITSSVYNGKKETINIKTMSNLNYCCTKDHKLFGIATEEPLHENKAENFKVGDYIARVNTTNIESYITPEVNYDWDVFTGIILGDGNVRNGNIRIAVNTLQLKELEPILKRIALIYNRDVKLYSDKRSTNWIDVNINSIVLSTDLNKYMYHGDFTSNRTSMKIIPEHLFTTTDINRVKNFLSGYMSADGCMNGQKTTFYSKYDHIATGIQRLLLRIGVISRKCKIFHKKLRAEGYRVDIDFINAEILFNAIPSFIIESKIKRIKSRNGYVAPIRIMRYEDTKYFTNKAVLFNNNSRTSKDNFSDKYENLFTGNVRHEKIINIESGKICNVYDISVEGNENFICVDGGLYHNCRNEPGILFIDNARKMNNLSYLNGDMLSTNPCVAAGTLVTTNNGVKLVENINIDDVIQTTLGFGKVKEVKIYEDQDIFRVYFSDGFYQDVTKGHIFHTMLCDTESRKKWSNSDRLSDINVNYFVRKEWYKSYPTINKALTRDEGLLIGLYLGDGCYSNYSGFNISINVIEDNSYIEELFNRLGGNTRIDKSEGNCCRYYLTGIKQYIDNLFNTVGINPDGKKIELCKLINTNKMFIVGLIDGLISSDGNINLSARYPQIRFDNANFEIHTLLKHLMLFVKSDYKVYNSKRVGERSSINGRFIERKQICYTGVIDNDSILNVYNELDYVSHKDKNDKLCTIIKTNQLNGVKWKTKIKSIERISSGTVYDIYESIADDWNHEGYVSRGCGEIFGHTGIEYIDGKAVELGDVCNLGSINLTKFFDVEKNKFCLIDFKEAIDVMVSALDNIIEISAYPLPMYEQAAKLKRKIGIGLMGIGSLMMMMNLRYGGDECLDVLDVILKEFINQAYKSSALLAKEKGPFELYSPELIECGYVKNGLLSKEVISLINKHGLRHSALSAIAPTGCLVDDTLISTSKGCLEISDAKEISLHTDNLELTSDFKNSSFKGWYDKGYSKTVQITTHHGYHIEGTLPHKVRTINNNGEYIWKELKDILVDDVVIMKKDFIFNNSNVDINEDLAELLGFYMAEGWFCNNRLYFQIHTDEEEYIKKLLTSCFSDKYTRIIVRKRDDTNSLRIEVNSQKIREWFDKNTCVKNGSSNAFIPKIIMCSNRSIIYSFIRGYFLGDGGFNAYKQCVKFTTVSKKMATQLHTILLGIGIPSHMYIEQSKGKEIEILHRKTKSNFNTLRIELSVFNSRKLCKLMGVDSKNVDMKYEGRNFEPILLLPSEHHTFAQDTFIKKYLDKGIICVTDSIYRKKIKEVNYNWFIKNNMFLDIVTTINNSTTLKHVQDLSVNDSSQTYIANGFITHNTLSIVAGNISGGVEPVFAREFTRWNRLEGKKADFKYPNIHIGEWFETDYFKEEKVADEVILISTDGKFRIDKNTGLCEKITITDYGYKIALEKGFTETATAMELSVEEHLKVLKLVSSYTDQGISKTINLPNDISFDSFKSLYGEIHSYGVKGCTTYREGTSIAILETQKKEQEKSVKKQQTEFLEVFEEQKNGDIITSDVQLPDEYPAKGYIFKSDGGKKWYVHVAFKDKACTRPFAIFVNTNNREDNVLTFNAIEKLEEIAIFKGINNYFMEETKKKYAYQKNPVKICRMLGLLLRHNVDVFTIIKGLSELEPTVGTFVFHITKFLGRFVKEHDILGMVCPECGEKSMKFYEGCISCTCGYSRCG